MINEQRGQPVFIPADSVTLEGTLVLPRGAKGVVLFAHGSGSGRFSPRNKFVAEVLNKGQIGTLLIDLLTAEEDADSKKRFDIGLLTRRVKAAVQWVQEQPDMDALPVGLFGASTGAAAALKAAAHVGPTIRAVVSRGGRTDLAQEDLPRVRAPTLLIVGSKDEFVLRLNQESYRALKAAKGIEVVSGATHLFEEPGALEEVADLAAKWFTDHFP